MKMSVIGEGTLFADEELPEPPELRVLERFVYVAASLLPEDSPHNDAEVIMDLAYERDSLIQRELGQLSTVLSLLLGQMANRLLGALGNRLSGIDSRWVLEMLADSLQGLAGMVDRACGSDPIEAFRAKFLAELTTDDPF